MKSGRIIIALAGIVLLTGLVYAFTFGHREQVLYMLELPADAKAESQAAAVVHVDELAEAPGQFPGEIILKAAVARVNQSQGVFSVIDFREFERCGEVTCARHYLPVTFAGPLPESKTVVEITGQVVRTDKGLVFRATQMDVKE